MRATFFLDIVNKLKSIVDNDNKPVIKHFDLWNEQIAHGNDGQIFAMPAIFIEYNPIKWEQLGALRQTASVSFNLIIVSETKARSSDNSPTQDKALAHLQLIGIVHKCLQNWNGDYFGSLTRTDSVHNHDFTNILAHVETYRSKMIDDSAKINYLPATNNNIHITKTLKTKTD